MSIDRMDKDAMAHIYDEILLSYKKECIWVSATELNEPRAYYTKWNKSEREKQILYININLKSRKDGSDEPICRAENGNADIENRFMDTGMVGMRVWDEHRE